MTRARRIVCLAVGLLAATAIASPALADKTDNSVRFAYEQTLESIDPYFNNILLGVNLADAIWDTLIFQDSETGAYRGNLATAWRWIDDRTVGFDLRAGVRLHCYSRFGFQILSRRNAQVLGDVLPMKR